MNSIAQTNNSENPLSEKMQYFLRRYHVSRIGVCERNSVKNFTLEETGLL